MSKTISPKQSITKQVTLQDAMEYLYDTKYTGSAILHLWNGKITAIHTGYITKFQIDQEQP